MRVRHIDGDPRNNDLSNIELVHAPCRRCEASPGDNDHCVYTGAPHAWHRCDGIMAPDSDCPEAPIHQVGSAT